MGARCRARASGYWVGESHAGRSLATAALADVIDTSGFRLFVISEVYLKVAGSGRATSCFSY
jgi:hypothetical protein